MAFSHLVAAGFSEDEAKELTGASDEEARVVSRMIERGINTPFTSSLGRLFDAAAALILKRRTVDYEAQAAIELEGIALNESDRIPKGDYIPQLSASSRLDSGPSIRLDGLWHAMVEDLRSGVPEARIGAQFHAGISEAFIAVARSAGNSTGIRQVALSGGCMHNRRLARLLRSGLEREGFQVLQQRSVSPGDGGLSYGQAVVGASILYSESTH
jgi:hydrogenase maturation protein HypF